MINEKIEGFLEKGNMNFLFCLLSKLESQRINQFPSYVKQKFDKKITVLAMEHVADNEVPDYIAELQEAELAMATKRTVDDDDEGIEFGEETIDDSAKFTHDFEQSDVSEYESFEEVKDPFANNDDEDADDDDFDDDDDDDDL
ncbi:MAG: hypothetical protein PHU99_04465 [Candidatus Cloacimonetes bacterium]|jgi:hypothetical protein|nr:hypothetical protein [Candidatus Cloacimonadota bacterium]MDY0337909.1 hypothetical protein [Candidatus Cloacimonadaceae bacterium]MCK9334310.1 hypothetical protein [Candidatus Cloacimonadota bacterium]MDD2544417.1 hypothetical protein [Candidatus Cloacimonadota bacterium]MDD2683900.1 hypothetical protein [Candidatus Cloacimonadota bacterium]